MVSPSSVQPRLTWSWQHSFLHAPPLTSPHWCPGLGSLIIIPTSQAWPSHPHRFNLTRRRALTLWPLRHPVVARPNRPSPYRPHTSLTSPSSLSCLRNPNLAVIFCAFRTSAPPTQPHLPRLRCHSHRAHYTATSLAVVHASIPRCHPVTSAKLQTPAHW
jgi:hypothetical protein